MVFVTGEYIFLRNLWEKRIFKSIFFAKWGKQSVISEKRVLPSETQK